MEMGDISTELHLFLTTVNKVRNHFAHRLGHDLSREDVYELVKLAGQCPEVEFTDDMDKLDIATVYSWYGDAEGVLTEMFKHVSMDISFVIEEKGGTFCFD